MKGRKNVFFHDKYNKQQLKKRIDAAMLRFFQAGRQVQRQRPEVLADVRSRPIEMAE